jgi:hypothetical protein
MTLDVATRPLVLCISGDQQYSQVRILLSQPPRQCAPCLARKDDIRQQQIDLASMLPICAQGLRRIPDGQSPVPRTTQDLARHLSHKRCIFDEQYRLRAA